MRDLAVPFSRGGTRPPDAVWRAASLSLGIVGIWCTYFLNVEATQIGVRDHRVIVFCRLEGLVGSFLFASEQRARPPAAPAPPAPRSHIASAHGHAGVA